MPDRGRRGSGTWTKNPSQAAWQRLSGNTIFKAPLSVAGVMPWFRIVRQPKMSFKTIKDEKVQMMICGSPTCRGLAAFFRRERSEFDLSMKASDSTAHRSALPEIQESDMLVVPGRRRPSRSVTSATTLVLICTIRDPMTGQFYSRTPLIAQKARLT